MAIIRTGSTSIGWYLYAYGKQQTPRVGITVSEARYKNWPRDCTITYDCKVWLNDGAATHYGRDITNWLCESNVKHTWIDSSTFSLYDIEDITMFKLTWSELLSN